MLLESESRYVCSDEKQVSATAQTLGREFPGLNCPISLVADIPPFAGIAISIRSVCETDTIIEESSHFEALFSWY